MTQKWFGWAGTILKVDLSRGKIVKQPLSKELAYNFLGGRGFNAKTLWDLIKPGIDPLSPENVLCLGVGPLNGTLMPLSGRMNATCKAPLTGILGDGNAGGHWPATIKHAGYDQIVFTGKSKEPVYLWIEDEDVELRDAKEIWGKTTFETYRIMKKEHGEDVDVCGIGPAGENLVKFANIMNDRYRQAGRTGIGAVMGSKKLKAITIRGTKKIEVYNLDKLKEICRDLYKQCQGRNTESYRMWGTSGMVSSMNEIAALPTRNWQ